MKTSLLAALLLCFGFLHAQTDPATYHIVLNDSTSFTGKLIAQIPKKIIHVLKPDSSEEYILWKNIKSINIKNADGEMVDIKDFSNKQLKELKAEQKSILDHQYWFTCFIIKQTGDTLYGKVKNRRNYSSTSAKLWENTNVFFTQADDKEIEYPLNTIKQLSIAMSGSGYVKYLSLDDGTGYYYLYRVIVDGKCQLVYTETDSYYDNPSWGNMPSVGGAGQTGSDYYYVFYKGLLTEMRTIHSTDFGSIGLAVGFKENCKEVFGECPALVEKIKQKELKSINLKQIVEEFNQCIQ